MPAGRSATGQKGEEAAAGYLVRHGCTILARNWRANPGEVDIIARCPDAGNPSSGDDDIVFVEVRTRHGLPGMAEESISPRKAASMTSAAYAYMAAHGLDPERTAWRIDLIAVTMRGSDIVGINWVKNAIES